MAIGRLDLRNLFELVAGAVHGHVLWSHADSECLAIEGVVVHLELEVISGELILEDYLGNRLATSD